MIKIVAITWSISSDRYFKRPVIKIQELPEVGKWVVGQV